MNETHYALISIGESIIKGFNKISESAERVRHSVEMFFRDESKIIKPNNRRKMNGKPMVRIKAHDKAFRNRRKNYGSN